MRNILAIGHNELRLFLKSRTSYFWLFVLPFAFVAVMSRVSYGDGKSSNRFPPVLIENADTGYLGNVFVDVLSAQGLWRLDPAKDKKNKPVRRIRIPADFTDRVLAKRATNVELLPVPGREDAQGDALVIEARLLRALVALNSHLLEASTGAAGVAPASLPAKSDSAGTPLEPPTAAGTEAAATTAQPATDSTLRRIDIPTVVQASLPANPDTAGAPGSAHAQPAPAGTEAGATTVLSVPQLPLPTSTPATTWPPSEDALRAVMAKPAQVALDAKFAGRDPIPSGVGFSLPGNLVYFLTMNLLIFGGATIAATRRSGVLKRLLTLPVRRGELIAGQLYGLWLLGAVQIGFLLLVGKLFFHLNIGANLPGVLLVLLVYSWVAAATGLLIGSLLDAPDRVVGVCVLASILMAAAGGCWFPLELAPEALRTAGHCVPTGWALDALHRLISFGGDLGSVVKPLLVLVGFGTAATAAAGRWFRV